MIEKKYYTFALGFLLLLFIASKWASLSLPYFWDEAWSYIPAITEMSKFNPCLLPGCIDSELYRGHPLLFYFLASGWMKFVGGSLFSMHMFALIISILAILSFYRLSLIVLPPQWSLFGSLLLILQEAFYVQSSFVIPEVLIMLLTMEGIRNYLRGRKFSFLLCAWLLCLTKEAGVVIISGFILFHIVRDNGIKKSSYWVYLSVLPAVAFYAIQKIQMGWFFYPLHVGLVDFSTSTLISKTEIILKFLFFEQGRKLLLIVLSIVFTFNILIRKRKVLFIPAAVILVLVASFSIFENIYSVIFLVTLLCIYSVKLFSFSSSEKQMITLCGGLFAIIIVFSALNFLMLRYLLFLFSILILITSILFNKLLPARFIYYIELGMLLSFYCIYSIYSDYRIKTWHDDVSINYVNMVKVHQQTIQYCEQHQWFDKKIFTHFLMQRNLINPDLGYLTSSVAFHNVSFEGDIKPDDEIIIISCIEYDEGKHQMIKDNPRYQLVQRFEVNEAWSEVFVLQNELK